MFRVALTVVFLSAFAYIVIRDSKRVYSPLGIE